MLTGTLHAGITGAELTIVDFSNGYINADGTINPAGADDVADAWTAFSETWQVVRLWAIVENDDDTVAMFSGSEDLATALILDPGTGGAFYNNVFGGLGAPNTAVFAFFPEAAFDSYITIGSSDSGGVSISTQDTNDALNDLAGEVSEENLGWFVAPPVAGAGIVDDGDGGYRVLLAQLTVPACAEGVRVQGLVVGGGDTVTVDLDGDAIDAVACCLPDGSCTVMRPCVCDAAGGTPTDSAMCTLNLCADAEPCTFDIAPTPTDGVVDFEDLLTIILCFGSSNALCDVAPDNGDGTNGDGVVDITDLLLVLNNFGACP